MSLQDPRTSERYMPRFEIWMNVFIHYAMINVVNSLSTLEFESAQRGSHGGSMASGQAYAAWDKLVGNVLILEAHVMDLWTEKDTQFLDSQTAFHASIRDEHLGFLGMIEVATRFYHAIIELMRRRGLLRFKPPRSFGRRHDE